MHICVCTEVHICTYAYMFHLCSYVFSVRVNQVAEVPCAAEPCAMVGLAVGAPALHQARLNGAVLHLQPSGILLPDTSFRGWFKVGWSWILPVGLSTVGCKLVEDCRAGFLSCTA